MIPEYGLLTVHVTTLKPALYYVQRATIPTPQFLQKKIGEAGVGTFRDIATIQQAATVYDALSIFVERRVSALPVVDETGNKLTTQSQAKLKSLISNLAWSFNYYY